MKMCKASILTSPRGCVDSIKIYKVHSRGVLKFGFGRDVPPRNLKVDPYKY